MIKLAGATVDADDPCQLKVALELVRLRLIAGDHVEEVEIRSPVTQRRMKVVKANLDELNQEIQRLDAACRRQQGCRTPSRRWRLRF